MFEWLEREISEIRTPRFHLVDGFADEKLRAAILESSLCLPPAYKEFAFRFGNAKLFRRAQNDSYRIGVFAAPREAKLTDGRIIYQLGFHDGASVFVKPGTTSSGLPIFEFETGLEENVANSFEEWLADSYNYERSRYSREEWANIFRGPKPFSPDEEEIIELRKKIHWQVRGIDPAGDHIFEVVNTGSRTMSVLTLGARSKNGRLNGTIRLNIGHVIPGRRAILHVGCYKGLLPPQDIEIFGLPDPRPEDRERFGEFLAAADTTLDILYQPGHLTCNVR